MTALLFLKIHHDLSLSLILSELPEYFIVSMYHFYKCNKVRIQIITLAPESFMSLWVSESFLHFYPISKFTYIHPEQEKSPGIYNNTQAMLQKPPPTPGIFLCCLS